MSFDEITSVLSLKANQIKTLASLIDDEGLTSPVTLDEIDSLMTSDLSPNRKQKMLDSWHKALHEILYAPPRRGT